MSPAGGLSLETLFGPGFVSVLDYGAKANGATNDTQRIHDALLALPPVGGTVIFPAGSYFLGQNVTFQGRTNVTFWLMAGATFVGPGALPASTGSNRVFDMSFVTGSFPPAGPAGGALAGAYPNPDIAAGAVATASLADAGVTAVKLGTDVPRRNYLLNPSYDQWQRPVVLASGNYGPDGWYQTWLGTATLSTLAPDTVANVDVGSLASLMFVAAGATSAANAIHWEQKLEQWRGLRGQQLELVQRVRTLIGGQSFQLYWSDGVTGGGALQLGPLQVSSAAGFATASMSFTPSVNATSLVVGVAVWGNTTWWLDNAALEVGTVPALAAGERSLASEQLDVMRFYEKLGIDGGNDLIFGAIATGAGQNFYVYYPFRVPKAVAPSVTKTGTWNVVNCGQPFVQQSSKFGVRMQLVSVAAGEFRADNSAVGCNIVAEGNL